MKLQQKSTAPASSSDHKLPRVPSSFPLRPSVQILLLLVLVLLGAQQAKARTWSDFWLTPDQQGRRLFARGEFAAAANAFRDPMWQGAAWFRAGEFEKAAQAFARRDTAEAHYNQGNAWLMRGRYDTAVASYERALTKRPNWKEAIENRNLASARAQMTEQTGGDMGDQKLGADEIVFDKKKGNNDGQETEVNGDKAMSNQEIQALWLRRVQTKPADFLKVKFAYQRAVRETTPDDE